MNAIDYLFTVQRIWDIGADLGWNNSQIAQECHRFWGTYNLHALTDDQLRKFIQHLLKLNTRRKDGQLDG